MAAVRQVGNADESNDRSGTWCTPVKAGVLGIVLNPLHRRALGRRSRALFSQVVMTCRLAEPARTGRRSEGGSVLKPLRSPGLR